HRNPPIDPLTGTYEEGRPVRTNPFRLTFNEDTGLQLKLGLTGNEVLDVNLIIGGLYGFLLVVILVSVGAAVLAWAWVAADVGRYRSRVSSGLSVNPTAHWFILLLPVIFFGLCWLTQGHGAVDPVLLIGAGERE